MSSRNVFASILMACLLTIGFGGLATTASALPAGPSTLKPGETAGNSVIEAGYRHRGPRVRLRIGPSYTGYDYPYYYSRGYYPRHIGRGYVYYGYPYKYYKRVYAPRYEGRGHYRGYRDRHY